MSCETHPLKTAPFIPTSESGTSGLSGHRPVEYPVVRNGTVIRFEAWLPSRTFAVDMAGFAVHLKVILKWVRNYTYYGVDGRAEQQDADSNRAYCILCSVNVRLFCLHFSSTVEFGKSCKKGANSPETCFLSDLGFDRKDIEPFGWDSEVCGFSTLYPNIHIYITAGNPFRKKRKNYSSGIRKQYRWISTARTRHFRTHSSTSFYLIRTLPESESSNHSTSRF